MVNSTPICLLTYPSSQTPHAYEGHYPIFHQMEGVRLFSINEMNKLTNSSVFHSEDRTPSRQELHSQASADMIGSDLKVSKPWVLLGWCS